MNGRISVSGIDLRADVPGFGTVEQVIEPRLGGQKPEIGDSPL
jgi:hypothetical protein